jgi:enolase-phosphatase E1
MDSYRAVLLDVEGTTTPISFVYETLFPYARRQLGTFLREHWDDPEVRQDVELVIQEANKLAREHADDPEFVPVPSDSPSEDVLRTSVVRHLEWQMDQDLKSTGLKSIQGRVWKSGYTEGKLKAPVYEDVPAAFEAWQESDTPLYIYSSGSVEAQRLLFSNTERGDLTEFIDGYFDTRTGPKKEADSYRAIAESIGVSTDEIIFVTDDLDEAIAADEARCQAVISRRPGNPDIADHSFEEVESLEPVVSA